MRLNANRVALLLCLAFALLALLYAAATPPFESPDEASHFLYAHNLQRTGQLPILEDRAIVFASQSAQRHHPPLYYALGALLIAPTQRADLASYLQINPLASLGVVAANNVNAYLHTVPAPSGDTAAAIWLFRAFSIALSTASVWFIYRAALLVVGARTALLALLLVIAMPTFIAISASVNNDNLVTLLHAAGVYYCLKWWQARAISPRDVLHISLILSAVALTKVNGLTLFGIVYGWLLLGALLRRFHWRTALGVIVISLVAAALLAGWWYLRNLQLYGDPLALNATLRIWGRGGDPHAVPLSEAVGIWESFWFMLGHFNVRAPQWLYTLYLPFVTIIALVGIVVAFLRRPALRLHILFLLGVVVLAVLALLVATSRIDISQGRILFPGLVAFAPLVALGWSRLFGRFAPLLVVPLMLLALLTPFTILPQAYPAAQVVSALPASAQRVDVSTPGLTILAYERLTDTREADGWVRFNLYFSGAQPENPYLFVKALYPLTGDVLGGVDIYPGMLPTSAMQPDLIYAVPIRFRIAPDQLAAYAAPYRIDLVFGWSLPAAADQPPVLLPLFAANGTPVDAPLLPGPTVLNSAATPAPQIPLDVVYGNQIRLTGYSLDTDQFTPGGSLRVTLNWQSVAPVSEDFTVTIGLLDADEQTLATADGGVPGYPTSAWRPGLPFADTRTLAIPPEAAPGEVTLYVGWYRLADGLRLPAAGANILDDRYTIPLTLNPCPPQSCGS